MYSYLWEAPILELLTQHPVDRLRQVVGVDEDERLRLRERLQDEACQPHAARVVVVAERAVRAVRVTICQLTLVACKYTKITSKIRYIYSKVSLQ